jgi:hypothetical protein
MHSLTGDYCSPTIPMFTCTCTCRYHRDPMLCQLLRQAGPSGDAFAMIASTWLCPGTAPAAVAKSDREMAKRVTYGICYGLTPFGLAAALAEQGVDVAAASKLLSSFLNTFRGGWPAGGCLAADAYSVQRAAAVPVSSALAERVQRWVAW